MSIHSQPLYLGIDTGGTFTDGVLFDPQQRQVVRAAKVLTTHHDLKICIANILDELLPGPAPELALVSLSTTLATNAIAEGKRRPAALLLIGYDPELVQRFQFHRQFGTPDYFFIRGGHLANGKEREALDEEAIRRAAAQVQGRVDAFAVSAYNSPRNASHEQRAAAVLSGLTALPVVQAHHLSGELDSIRRATTASLNASLLAHTREFMEAVEVMLAQKGIQCPVMVMRGDGSIVRTDFARERPVEIIHSGPATSAIGGYYLAETEAALVVDMGGTTTDLCVVDRGRIETIGDGAAIGPYRTCVRTVKSHSFGLGGDSLIQFDHFRHFSVGPERVLPLSYLCHEHPQVKQRLVNWLRSKDKILYSDELEHWILRREPLRQLANRYNQKAVELLRAGPVRMRDLVKAAGAVSVRALDTAELVNQGIIERAGLTPTDILHVTQEFQPWDVEAAVLAVEMAARLWGEDAQAFAGRVKTWITRRIAGEIVQYLSGMAFSAAESGQLDRWLFDESMSGSGPYLGCRIALKVPLVGIGAPASAFLPAVAAALGTECILPPHYHVANAVGTVVGNVIVRQKGSVFPCLEGAAITGSLARVANSQTKFERYEEALEYVRTTLEEQVTAQSRLAGAESVVVECEERPVAEGMTEVYAVAIGKPGVNGRAVR